MYRYVPTLGNTLGGTCLCILEHPWVLMPSPPLALCSALLRFSLLHRCALGRHDFDDSKTRPARVDESAATTARPHALTSRLGDFQRYFSCWGLACVCLRSVHALSSSCWWCACLKMSQMSQMSQMSPSLCRLARLHLRPARGALQSRCWWRASVSCPSPSSAPPVQEPCPLEIRGPASLLMISQLLLVASVPRWPFPRLCLNRLVAHGS